jgi:hypothetical protein
MSYYKNINDQVQMIMKMPKLFKINDLPSCGISGSF